jgi:hypothetical protein
MRRIRRRGVVSVFTLLMMVALCLSTLSGVARSQTPGHQIGLNPEYAFPTKDTLPGAEVNSASLVENASLWNGRVVTFKGEAVGERMVRGPMAWIHPNDDSYMERNIEEGAAFEGYNSGHAVWLPAKLTQEIRFFGDFNHAGDLVKVTGVFNATCREHGGDMDIHASSVEIIRTGHLVSRAVGVQRPKIAVGLFVLASIFYGFRRIAERRRI